MVVLPLVALASVAITTHYTTDARLGDNRLGFEIQQVQRAGGGLKDPNDTQDDDFPVFRSQIELSENGYPIRFANGKGDVYSLQADRGFVAAFEENQRSAIAAINRHVTIAAVAVAIIAGAAAFWLSRRIVEPVRRLENAANDLEAGDYARRVQFAGSDEIASLARAFNGMAEAIERKENLRKQMTSDVAHELRSPLNNLTGYLEAIADGVVEPDADTIASLRDEADLLVRLVADLEQISLADAGRQVLHLQPVRFGAVVASAVAMMQPRARAHDVTIVCDASTPAEVEADPGRMAQVVRNLLENAITHTPSGGEIRVRVTNVDDEVLLTVVDSGPGIPEEHLPNIFERFYRADPSRTRATGGAGLGLAIVEQLVRVHGGTVSAANAEQGGAKFTIMLPEYRGTPDARVPVLAVTPAARPS